MLFIFQQTVGYKRHYMRDIIVLVTIQAGVIILAKVYYATDCK